MAAETCAYLALVDDLRQVGCDLVLLAENFDAGAPTGKFAQTLFAAMADLERATSTDRVMAGKRQKATAAETEFLQETRFLTRGARPPSLRSPPSRNPEGQNPEGQDHCERAHRNPRL